MKKTDANQDLRQEILNTIKNSQHPLTKSQIAKLLGLKGEQRIILKQTLKELYGSGDVIRGPRRRLTTHPSTTTSTIDDIISVEIVDVDEEGDFLAHPLEWVEDETRPLVRLVKLRPSYIHGRSALEITSKVIVRIVKQLPHEWQATVIRRIEKDQKIHVGIFNPNRHGGYLSSCNRKDSFNGAHINHEQAKGLKPGDVVKFSTTYQEGLKIIQRIGSINDSHIFSELAIHEFDIPHQFSPEALKIAKGGKIPPLENRTDYRNIDLVTIDGEDARDFDDAVWAEADTDPHNLDGWRAIVAIADVSYYVRAGSALDKEAYERGNSVYFPDRVVPMLPEALSNELCSLKPFEDRACMVIEMTITAHGKIKSHRVKRGLMRSRARLTYNQVQNALNGKLDAITEPLHTTVIQPLFGVYKSLLKAREQRGTLDLDVPERQILFNDNGDVKDIILRERLDSHKLIEELMIAANVAAAKTLIVKNWPCIFRIHDKPDTMRVENLRQVLKQMKLNFAKATSPEPRQFNAILHEVKHHKYERLINELVLRSQMPAKYSPDNIGHFGLSLAHYAHFTSPIRRYSDLIVHRCLISALNLGDDGYSEKPDNFVNLGEHISLTERTAAQAERQVSDRYAISYVANKVGENFKTVIVGVNRVGLFVEIPSSGAQGFIPKHSLGHEFHFDEQNHRFVGRRSKTSFQLGDTVEAFLIEANVVTNSLSFRLADFENRSETSRKHNEKRKSAKDHESLQKEIKTKKVKERRKPKESSKKVKE
ncbi:ribonuclease R [Candidatus Paracaedibacter symbiosus]|uniref:ribonuclease R n=1 Tax=Candidatus Paracaedibacter symbiosus TaxID=244582 RepID=UPI00068AC161|nr:ribonuclease R [Candidatus Paracaedibacter symbiosus]